MGLVEMMLLPAVYALLLSSRHFDIDIEWTVLDFIQYICNDNLYEWCIDKFIGEDSIPHYILHIGHELKPYHYRNATKPYEPEKDNISATIYGFKITTVPSPINILSHWEETHKCVWARHSAGKGGGISKGYFTKIGQGHFNTRLYLNSLEGDIERDTGFSRLKKEKKRFSSVTLGNITKDDGIVEGNTSPYIDEVSLQRNPHTYTIREPHNIIINTGEELAVQHQIGKVTRSTPYLDHNAGLLFPSPKLDKPPPNSIVFSVDGKRESSVVGGYVFGGGRDDLVIPYKESKGDLRLQLPNGWCLYIKEDGETFIQKEGADPTAVPSEGDTQIYLGANGSIKFNAGGHFLSHDTHKHGYQHIHKAGNLGIPVPPQDHIGPGIETDATTDNTTKTEAE